MMRAAILLSLVVTGVSDSRISASLTSVREMLPAGRLLQPPLIFCYIPYSDCAIHGYEREMQK